MKIKTISLIITLIILFPILTSSCLLADDSFQNGMAEHWQNLHQKLSELTTMLDKEREASDSSFLWVFPSEKENVENDMASLIDEALEILNLSDLKKCKDELDECRKDIQKSKAQIGDLKGKKSMAPKEVSGWKVWKKDQEDFETEIEELQNIIKVKEKRIEELSQLMLEKIREQGIDIDTEHIEHLIFSVTGNDDINMISVFNNIKTITNRLRSMTVESGEDIETARKYYGMNTVLLKILLRFQQLYINKVKYNYIPKIDGIIEENHKLYSDTKGQITQEDEAHQEIYRSNLRAQKLSIKCAEQYRKYLLLNIERVNALLQKTKKEYEASENTYRTATSAHNLIAMIHNADKMFNSLSELQVPELLKFENLDMKVEFIKLTEKLEKIKQ